ncbi:MAG: HlyC/CorC family transporter [Bacteroidetes bacterium]|nr:HlyC/CorC family transporter [Bacteroidota bacterium]MBK8143761.1 HlyC/CorC family transporter [Bacteroidota bacterium]MBP6315174.1 HlyC/CorC family transporter [Chitinophagaceae bacterium]
MLITILYIILCLLLIAFFSGIEIAFVSSSKLTFELKKKQGLYAGKVLSRFMEKPATFIGTSLVGINIVLVIYGLLMTEVTDTIFDSVGLPHNEFLRLFIDTIIATIVVLVLGEFIPKALFRAKPEATLTLLTLPIQFFYFFLYPLARLFVAISEFILKYLFNVRIAVEKTIYNRVDLEQFIKQMRTGQDSESQDLNTELFENALYLSQVKIRECLVPRNEIEAVSIDASITDVKKLFIESKLSKILVFEGSIDHILGYIHHIDFFKNPKDVKAAMHKIPAVPEAMNAVDLLNQFTKERKSIAWVIDEFGGTAGIVTMEDILEEIFGEIQDEYDEEEYVQKQLSATEYIFSGRLEVEFINEKYHLHLPIDEAETLSGYIIEKHESIPKQNEKIIIGDYEFNILLVSDTRIETVKLKSLQPNKKKD